jgi:hypothetical protein
VDLEVELVVQDLEKLDEPSWKLRDGAACEQAYLAYCKPLNRDAVISCQRNDFSMARPFHKE